MALQTRKMSPQSKIRERNGFVTATRVPDCFEDKAALAQSFYSRPDRATKQRVPVPNEYAAPQDPVFRDEKEIVAGMVDFHTRVKLDPMLNPHGLSVFASKPKYLVDADTKRQREEESAEKYQRLGQGVDWRAYHRVPELKTDIAAGFKDKHNRFFRRNKK